MSARSPPRFRQRQLLGGLEDRLLVVEDGDAVFVLAFQPLAPRVVTDQSFGPGVVRHREHGRHPDDALGPLRQRHHGTGEAGPRVHEVVEGDAAGRVGLRIAGVRYRRGRPGHAEQAERIVEPLRVAPEPIHLAAVDGGLHRILAAHPAGVERLGQRSFVTEQDGIAVEPLASESAQPIRHVAAFNFDLRDLAGPRRDPSADEPEAVLGRLVTVAADREVHLAAHEPRLVEGDTTGVVRDEPETVNRVQFHQRDAATGGCVHHADLGPDAIGRRRSPRARTGQ